MAPSTGSGQWTYLPLALRPWVTAPIGQLHLKLMATDSIQPEHRTVFYFLPLQVTNLHPTTPYPTLDYSTI